MKFSTYLLLSLVSFTSQLSFAQEPIKFEALVDGSSRMVNAIYSIPKQPLKPKSPAVVIMLAFPQFSRQILLSKSEWEKCK